MHEFLVKHNVSYGLYLVEPIEGLKFNRGLLMNIGFLEVLKESRPFSNLVNSSDTYWDCFIFHDVDLIPENDDLQYTCHDYHPIHFSTAVSSLNYT